MVQPKKKALFLGDFNDPNYHPATDIDQIVVQILKDSFNVTVEENYANLTLEKLREYDLLINYADCWGKHGSRQAVGAVLAYAAAGGAVLGLHSGIIAPMDQYPEIPMLFGARFTEHPPYTNLRFLPVEAKKDHPVMRGIDSFNMEEEPYFFEMCNFSINEILLEYEYEGKKYPAAWITTFGQGRVIYLYPGHDVRTFNHPDMRKLLYQSACWAVL